MELKHVTAGIPATWPYRITFGIAAIVGAVAIYFFLVGIGDGSVGSDNLGLWAFLLLIVSAVLWGGHAARVHGHPKAAVAILAILAVPGLLYALFILLVVASGTSWN